MESVKPPNTFFFIKSCLALTVHVVPFLEKPTSPVLWKELFPFLFDFAVISERGNRLSGQVCHAPGGAP